MQYEIINKMEVKDYKVDRDIYHLLKDEPFFALLSRQLDKRPTDTISTAGMRYNPDRLSYELIYNPKFMLELSNKHKKWVLMHELYHASLGHCQQTWRWTWQLIHYQICISMHLILF